ATAVARRSKTGTTAAKATGSAHSAAHAATHSHAAATHAHDGHGRKRDALDDFDLLRGDGVAEHPPHFGFSADEIDGVIGARPLLHIGEEFVAALPRGAGIESLARLALFFLHGRGRVSVEVGTVGLVCATSHPAEAGRAGETAESTGTSHRSATSQDRGIGE